MQSEQALESKLPNGKLYNDLLILSFFSEDAPFDETKHAAIFFYYIYIYNSIAEYWKSADPLSRFFVFVLLGGGGGAPGLWLIFWSLS